MCLPLFPAIELNTTLVIVRNILPIELSLISNAPAAQRMNFHRFNIKVQIECTGVDRTSDQYFRVQLYAINSLFQPNATFFRGSVNSAFLCVLTVHAENLFVIKIH